MNLDDYIYNVKNPQKKEESKPIFEQFDLGYYNNVSKAKKQLIREVFPHFEDNMFKSLLERYESQSSEYAYYQSRTDEGAMGLVRMKICDLVGSYDMPRAIPADEFYDKYYKTKRFGAQKYTNITIQTYHDVDGENNRYMNIFYTDDGEVFINSYASEVIEKMTEEQLGGCLARICVNMEEEARKRRLYKSSQKVRK